ncbi:MAG: DUF4440 domain-containing protein [Terriglobia bacterium]|jgi:uncharacterized protein (TIGR02246 family)|nr:DUF4440 domain-containing protein [Terriglobia bacterium]
MLKLGLLLLISNLALGQALPQHPQQCAVPGIESVIQKVAQDWKDGYNSGNPDAVAALYAEDATYLTQHFATGIVHGRPAIKAYVKRGTDAKYKIESLKVLASSCSQEFAYAITRYDSMNAGQSVFGVNLVIIRKIKGKWLIVAHESAVPDPNIAMRTLEIPDK